MRVQPINERKQKYWKKTWKKIITDNLTIYNYKNRATFLYHYECIDNVCACEEVKSGYFFCRLDLTYKWFQLVLLSKNCHIQMRVAVVEFWRNRKWIKIWFGNPRILNRLKGQISFRRNKISYWHETLIEYLNNYVFALYYYHHY